MDVSTVKTGELVGALELEDVHAGTFPASSLGYVGYVVGKITSREYIAVGQFGARVCGDTICIVDGYSVEVEFGDTSGDALLALVSRYTS